MILKEPFDYSDDDATLSARFANDEIKIFQALIKKIHS